MGNCIIYQIVYQQFCNFLLNIEIISQENIFIFHQQIVLKIAKDLMRKNSLQKNNMNNGWNVYQRIHKDFKRRLIKIE
ncbi:unnamed protein product [Paramecium sonneborni]|uniref:Uncharacterized protein n=1 Tax=Paramecium sonneborni TaxID=65129 RepID=A0A8S1RT26_9CILI|nr:unnamed protein product [Paramecium sonneborni]